MIETFAQRRSGQQDRAIERLLPLSSAWLNAFGSDSAMGTLVDAATDVWLDTFEAAAPEAYIDAAVGDFRELIGEYLSRTTDPEGAPTEAQVRRVATWLSTVATNDATWQGFQASGGLRMRWVSRRDERARPTHRAAHGQIRSVMGRFDVGGAELRYPGDPHGPLSEVMECRCVLAPAGRVRSRRSITASGDAVEYDVPETEEMDMTDTITASAAIDIEVEDELTEVPEDVDMDDEDFVDEPLIEIPVHGVATIQGKPTGDGRMFATGALTNRPLPLPMRYEFVGTHGGDTSMVAPVGRIDEIWLHPTGEDGVEEYRYRGVIITTKQYANEALEGIADGSLTGVSVETDEITVDVSAQREEFIQSLTRDRDSGEVAAGDEPTDVAKPTMSDQDIAELVDAFIGDGTMPLTVYSAARVCGFTIVPIPAFHEGYIALGHAFPDELSDEDQQALAACGCYDSGPEDEDNPSVELGYDAFRDVPAEERKRLAKEGNALPDGSFPIANVDDLKNAIQAIGRAKDPEAAKAHIKKRARALGHEELIPEDWAVQETEAMVASGGGILHIPDTFAPGTKDGPGWVTHPRATARIRRYWVRGKGAAKIKWGAPGDFNRCRTQLAKYVANPDWLAGLCANMHYEALKFWPGEHHSGRGLVASAAAVRARVSQIDPFMVFDTTEEDAPRAIVAGGAWPDAFPASAFANPELGGPTPITFTEDGRVFGHIATWDSCHIAMDGVCTNPPASRNDYRYFRKGVVDTDEGPITVGHITFGTGHIGVRATAAQATAHYDKPDAVRAYIATGEDVFGIWFAGVVKPGTTKDQVKEFKALGGVSGDWRWIGRDLELVGVTAVPVNGFQIERQALVAAANGHQLTLIAPPVIGEQPLEGVVESFDIGEIALRAALVAQDLNPRIARLREVRSAELAARIERVRATREA